jgi:predicted O-methyltransferase YrrM
VKARSVEEIGRIAQGVEGWLGRREGRYLYALARVGSEKGVIVEIGSWKGKSTIYLAEGSRAGGGASVYAVDPHVGGPDQEKLGIRDVNTEAEFRENIRRAGVDGLVIPVVQASMDAVRGWSKPIGLLWIDGDHRYESVRDDFVFWEPHVVEGGILAFHDTYSWEGVRKLVDEIVLRREGLQVLGQLDGILAVRKVPRLGVRDRFKRGVVRLLRRIYDRARSERRHWRALPRKLLRGFSTPKI